MKAARTTEQKQKRAAEQMGRDRAKVAPDRAARAAAGCVCPRRHRKGCPMFVPRPIGPRAK